MITLSQPLWLLLLIPLGITLYWWPLPTRWLRVCRALVVVIVVVALCHPAIQLPDRAGTVVVVADRSDSLPPGSAAAQKEIINLLHQSMGPRDQLAVVSFGHEAVVERPPQRGEFGGFSGTIGADQSNLNDGLETALGLVSPGSPGRILLLSDGKWTGKDPASAAARAAERGIALDHRAMARPQVNEIAIQQFQAPQSVAPQEAFVLNAWVQSPVEQDVQYQLLRGAQTVASGTRKVTAGSNRLMFRDRAGDQGTLHYQLTVQGAETDPFPENNQARALVDIRGTRSILAVSEAGNDSGLRRLLGAGSVDLIAKKPAECRWNLEDISQYSAVLLENVMANHLGVAGMETLASWVEQTGSGLMITGGKKSFGPGGYFRSPLERIIPVSMEMRQEHRKSRLAIVVTLDRSGSMAMSAGGGRTKIELAALGTVQVLDMLGPLDEIGVIAVDSIHHVIVDLNTVEKNVSQRNKILAIDSMGGGIFIFEALSSAAKMLMQAQAETKHIILFADSSDSEEPGRYEELLANCRQAGITVSVVGLGTPGDVDAPLLQDIARRGEGNCYFSDSPFDIPRLFAQDTFTVARSSFIEETIPLKVTAAMNSLGGLLTWQPPTLGGYNLCYARPEASLAAVTTDEYAAPVVAGWQAGSGRVVCFTGEADGKFSGAFAQWKEAGDFYSTLIRWAAGEQSELPRSMLLTQEIEDGCARVRLNLDPARETEPFAEPPKINVLHGMPGQPPGKLSLSMQWSSADTVETQVPIRGRETVLATVTVPGFKPVTLSPVCLPYSPEFKPDATGRGPATLKRLAQATGGEERIELAKIWKALPVHLRRVSLTPWLVMAALLLFLTEILQRRTGYFTRRARPVPASSAAVPKVAATVSATRSSKPKVSSEKAVVAESKPDIPEKLEKEAPPEPPSAPVGTLEAMRRARQRAKSRQGEGRN